MFVWTSPRRRHPIWKRRRLLTRQRWWRGRCGNPRWSPPGGGPYRLVEGSWRGRLHQQWKVRRWSSPWRITPRWSRRRRSFSRYRSRRRRCGNPRGVGSRGGPSVYRRRRRREIRQLSRRRRRTAAPMGGRWESLGIVPEESGEVQGCLGSSHGWGSGVGFGALWGGEGRKSERVHLSRRSSPAGVSLLRSILSDVRPPIVCHPRPAPNRWELPKQLCTSPDSSGPIPGA